MTAAGPEQVVSEARAVSLRRMLLGVLALALLLVVAAVIGAAAGAGRFGLVVGVVGLVLTAASGGTLWLLRDRGSAARRGCVATAVLLIVGAVPLVSVFIGLVMALAGVGLLFLLFAPETEGR